jgi:ABC-2 type transport system permease protein
LDLIGALKKNYELFPVDLRQSPTLDGLDAVFVLKPDQPFNDDDKFKIDQFIMNGGKALFFMDAVKVDSVAREGNMAQVQSVGLEDLLFKYGVRLNPNLIKDAQMCAKIPLDVGNFGNSSNIKLVDWQYYPLINSFGNSPIVRNLDAIYTKYIGSLDTVRANGVTKTPLLMTSQYTQVLNAPAIMSYNFASKDLNANQYKAGILPSDPRSATFKGDSKGSKIIVCSDGDIPVNDFDKAQNTPLPLGFDKYTGNTFANKDFVLNAIDYLLDDNGVITARNKEITLRPLDKAILQNDRQYWQSINLIIPIVLLGLVGFLKNYLRTKKYA